MIKNGIKNAKKLASGLLSNSTKQAKKQVELTVCKIKNLLNKKKRKKCERSVNDKYNNSGDSCVDNEYVYTDYRSLGDIYSLINHNITCPEDNIITSSMFQQNASNLEMRYKYKCANVPKQGTCVSEKTSEEMPNRDTIENTADTLAKLNISCNDGYALTRYQLVKTSAGKIRYDYTCCQVATKANSCQTEKTNSFMNNENTLESLINNIVEVNQGQYIQKLRLRAPNSSEFFYEFVSCKLNTYSIDKFDTGCTPDESGSIVTLSYHEVDCKHAGLTKIALEKDGSEIHYGYACIKDPNNIDSSQCVEKSTGWTSTDSDLKKSLNSLNRLDVDCPDNSVLSRFKLNYNNKQVEYEYTCCTAKINSCETMYTSYKDIGDWQVYNLDPIDMVVNSSNKVITRFKGERKGRDNDVRYTYEVCTLG